MSAWRDTRLKRLVVAPLLVALLVLFAPDPALARTPPWIRRIGHIAEQIVKAPGRVATWSTRWMGPVLGPVAAMWLTGRIVADGDISRIVKRAGNIQRAAQDVKALSDSAEQLRQVYRSEAEANRKLAEQMSALETDLEADGFQPGDLRRIIDLRRMQQAYATLAERLDARAEGVGTKDVLALFSRSAVKRLASSGQDVLAGQLSAEVRRLLSRDALVVLNGNGLNAQSVFESIVEHDAQRLLAGTEHAGDKDFEERFRKALKERLKQDKEFLRKNWRPEIARLIAEVDRRLKAERGQAPTSTASAIASVTEEQIGVNPEEASEGVLPGEGPEGLGVLPGTPKDKQWVVWVAQDVGYRPIVIQTVADFEKAWPGNAFPGGGNTADAIRKKRVGGPFGTLEEARRWLKGQLTEFGYLSGVYAGMYVAKFQGETHNIEMIGFDPQK